MLYVSPLKALNYDIERNLRGPLAGLDRRCGSRCAPATRPRRNGASSSAEPPDILITTPESLYLMLTSQAARRCAASRR